MSPSPLDAKAATGLFAARFGYRPARTVRSPGRVEWLGNHTDYNQGLVLSLAVDRSMHMASAPRSDGRVRLTSGAFDFVTEFRVSNLVPDDACRWANYVKGVLRALRARGVHFGGFDAAIHSTIPLGGGMSSSAALEIISALTVRQWHPYSLTDLGTARPPDRDRNGVLPDLKPAERMALAKLCQRAENDFVGVQCGLLDPVSCLFGKAHHAILLDCLHENITQIALPSGISFVLSPSGVNHDLASGEYNQLRSSCESAAAKLGVKALRFADPARLRARRRILSNREYRSAYHIIGENQRVVFAERAIRENDMVQMGAYMIQSHESSRDFFGNSCPELDALVRIAAEFPGCFGSRLTGGGFGGAAIHLVDETRMSQFMTHLSRRYTLETGRPLAPLHCRVADGAG